MVINGQEYADREEAGKALMSAVHGNISTDMVEIGSYRGFTLATEVNFGGRMLYLKGEMIHRAEMGTDPRGNILRLDHALDKMPERLKAVEAQLANILEQQKAAKAEVGKPFPQEEELKQKSARLAILDAQLNIGGGPVLDEPAIAKSERPSVLSKLKEPPPVRGTPDKPFRKEMEAR